ncbi:hypothetical protein DRT60_00180 [Salmonella enterica subsp. enterica serovar Altona]|nr:hypothetical protein [Salmonella enterica subsp. enterica serovar Altona]EDS7055014.1 hypothetical protein [Salmonella enterica subsp. enterica]EDU6305010.1 hypothetical protein [Salmonella enterica subsp. enterica serovar Ughelli]EBV0272499.1 hypothetical protein [Salmonella enterica subsp. enterica serovar Altona]EBW7396440.1 hypothetical protein [Salmonella enterica subsp. enterica serovar Altona]
MTDMYNTEIPALLVAAIKNADAGEARRMFDDADFCGRGLLNGLISTGRLLSGMGDGLDPQMWELRSLGDSIAITAELVAGFNEVIEAYNYRVRIGEINGGGRHE